jgi:MoxR-like ATPase
MSLRETFLAVERELNESSLEREDVVRGLMLAVLAREHLFLLGPPGTAKTALVTALVSRIEGATRFATLLTRFSTPEEVLGAISIPALEKGVHARVTDGMLPEAHFAFLDEIFKANAAILNALLTLMNERLFRNAGRLHDAPLISLFAASNELPQADELSAVYDRLLLRYDVGYLADEGNVAKLLRSAASARSTTKLSLALVESAQVESARVRVPDDVIALLVRLRAALKQAGIAVSDRRFKASLAVLRGHAWLEGRAQVAPEDVEVLVHVFWSEPKDRRTVAEEVLKLASPATAKALELRDLAAEQHRIALEKTKTEAEVAEAMTKLKGLAESLVALKRELALQGTVPPRVERLLLEVQTMRRQVLKERLGVEV